MYRKKEFVNKIAAQNLNITGIKILILIYIKM